MKSLQIGEVVREARIRHGLTQEDLADGICAVSTVSKIENGHHNPQKRVFAALMERMGERTGRYVMLVGAQEMEKEELREELAQSVRCGDRKSLEQNLEQYRILPGEKKADDLQWMELAVLALSWWNGTSSEKMEEELLELLYLTYPEYNGNWEAQRNYSSGEILIFQLMAACREHEMEHSWCLERLEQVLKVLAPKNTEQLWQKQAQISVCYQMAALCLLMEEYPGSVRYGADGLALCSQTESYRFAPMLLSVFATGMTKLGDTQLAGKAEMYACLVDKMLAVKKELQMFIEDIL